jgi:DNA topoisomerase-1
VATLKKRRYVSVQKRRLMPTELGEEVHRVLSEKLPSLFEVSFTAEMESALDEIADGQRDAKSYLKSFWSQVSPLFGESVIDAVLKQSSGSKKGKTPSKGRKPAKKKAEPISSEYGICPKCGSALVKRSSKKGDFIGCTGFPKCRYTKNLTE